jgi:hypothetical protein
MFILFTVEIIIDMLKIDEYPIVFFTDDWFKHALDLNVILKIIGMISIFVLIWYIIVIGGILISVNSSKIHK